MTNAADNVGRRIWVFDTTLRDGEQSPGATMTVDEKLEVADALVELGVDIIEAGFPAASPGDFEFSAEDATRSDWEYLVQVFGRAIEAGATTLNVPDTVGYTTPAEYRALMEHLQEHVPGIEKAIISVHCHNDLGMGTANTLAA